jgi:arginine deiminase
MKQNVVNVYNEIGQIKEVIVHRPGRELINFNVNDTYANLFDEMINYKDASSEHDAMVNIIKKNGGKVIYITDLLIQTYNAVDKKTKNMFIDKFVNEIVQISNDKKINGKPVSNNVKLAAKKYLQKQKNTKDIIFSMIEGITSKQLKLSLSNGEFVVPAMSNMYFMRDTISMIGNAINIHHMKYPVRDRESLLTWFVFNYHPRFKNVPKLINRDNKTRIEGGDIFPYNKDILVIGVSDRTDIKTIILLAERLKKQKATFKYIVAINVPAEHGLMHLDTWLTMIDHNKFIFSPNIFGNIKF